MAFHALRDVKSIYSSYDELVEEVGADVIENCFCKILACMKKFVESVDGEKQLYVNERILLISLLDYYVDIKRLKAFHSHINEINDYKAKAYEVTWLLRRKPIQVLDVCNNKNDKFDYINEQFVFSYLMSFLLGNIDVAEIFDGNNDPKYTEKLLSIKGFVNTLLYYLKFRNCGAQELELMLMAFDAGNVIGQLNKN